MILFDVARPNRATKYELSMNKEEIFIKLKQE